MTTKPSPQNLGRRVTGCLDKKDAKTAMEELRKTFRDLEQSRAVAVHRYGDGWAVYVTNAEHPPRG
jgi:hypothetical protein